jgi:hypothetical protein
MSKRPHTFFSFTAAALASAVALLTVMPGCSDEPVDDTCHDYSTFNKDSKVVSFKTDVLPIFRNSCGLSAACHQSQTGPAGQPFLGPAKLDPDPTQTDIDKIFAQNVGVTSTKAGALKIVEAGNPEMSFLMHKMDNTLKCADVKCEATCGQLMPLGSSAPLDAPTRDTVRLWIAQGAKND